MLGFVFGLYLFGFGFIFVGFVFDGGLDVFWVGCGFTVGGWLWLFCFVLAVGLGVAVGLEFVWVGLVVVACVFRMFVFADWWVWFVCVFVIA